MIIAKWMAGAVAAMLTLALAGWLAFVPGAREAGYEFVAAWGEPGSAPGQFKDPTGIAVAGDEVFVADARNGRIQVFDWSGKYLREFGQPGDGVGELGRPMNLTIHESQLYIPEYFNDRIQIFNLDGRLRRIVTGEGAGQFSAPGGVAVAPDGTLYVAGFYHQRIQKFAADDRFIGQLGDTDKVGIWAGQFNYPTDVALAADGTLYVADGYNDRVQVFDPKGNFLHKWGGPLALNIFGPFNGWFATVTSITIGPDGNVFVADFYNHRIQKFAPDGTFLTSFGQSGNGTGHFNYPMAVAVADDGTVFVTDFGNNRVHKWAPIIK